MRRYVWHLQTRNPVQSNEVRRAAQWPPWAGPPRRWTPATGSFLCTACLSGFRVESPAQGRHSGTCRCCLRRLAHHARTVWSARHMDHRGARIRCDIITSRARQLDMCGTALLSLQDHRVLSVYFQHAAWERSTSTEALHAWSWGCGKRLLITRSQAEDFVGAFQRWCVAELMAVESDVVCIESRGPATPGEG